MSDRPPPLPLPLPDPPLGDGGVGLRPWARADAPALASAWADPEIARWAGVPRQNDAAAAARWIAGDADRRARGLSVDLVIDVDGQVAGEVGLVPLAAGPRRDRRLRTLEIGWWVAPDRRGQGLACTAARLLATWALEDLCVDHVVARCDPANPASGAVAGAAGFVRTGAAADGRRELWRFPAHVGAGATIGA